MSVIKFTSALTPALSPRRGSAEASFGLRTIYGASEKISSAAADSDLTAGAIALPLLGERAGVRAVNLRLTSSFQSFTPIHHV